MASTSKGDATATTGAGAGAGAGATPGAGAGVSEQTMRAFPPLPRMDWAFLRNAFADPAYIPSAHGCLEAREGCRRRLMQAASDATAAAAVAGSTATSTASTTRSRASQSQMRGKQRKPYAALTAGTTKNSVLNRYCDILPYDDTLVTLGLRNSNSHSKSGTDGSDVDVDAERGGIDGSEEGYINASWVREPVLEPSEWAANQGAPPPLRWSEKRWWIAAQVSWCARRAVRRSSYHLVIALILRCFLIFCSACHPRA